MLVDNPEQLQLSYTKIEVIVELVSAATVITIVKTGCNSTDG